MNRIDLIGHLGQDPKSDVADNGTPYSHFSLATDEFWRDSQQKLHKRTEWHSVFFWGPRAENVRLYLRKGAKVRVEGRLESREEGPPTARVRLWSVRGRLFEMLDRKERTSENEPPDDVGGHSESDNDLPL